MPRQRREIWRHPAFRLGLMAAAVAAVALAGRSIDLAAHMSTLRVWIGDLGAVAPTVYVLGYVLATLVWVPGTLLTVLAAIIFGPRLGLVVMIIASTLAALAGFLIARHLARARVEDMLGDSRVYRRLQHAIDASPMIAVPFARLFPAFPFVLVNYVFGLSRVPTWKYLLGSEMVMIPMNVVWVLSAAAVYGAVLRGETPWSITLVSLGAALALASLGWILHRVMRRTVDARRRDPITASPARESEET